MIKDWYTRLAVNIFGSIADKYYKSFEHLKTHLIQSNTDVTLRAWISIMFLSVSVSYTGSLISVFILNMFLSFDFAFFIYMLIFLPVVISALVFLFFYYYPVFRVKGLEKAIEIDLPFALSHMSAIASSGVPVEYLFELLMEFEEYKAISRQARLVVRNVREFGMSSVKAMGLVAERSPSAMLKQVLNGMASTIEKGGDLSRYLEEMSSKTLFDYRIKREAYLKTLSMYADIYTALLVAAPLMMLAVLAILNIIGGEVMGLSIQDMTTIITFIALPVMNIGFLVFIDLTHPGV
jgi:flagellar protein FlaJ